MKNFVLYRTMKQGWEIKKIKDICDKASSNIAQNKITKLDGDYPVFGASGFIQNIDFYHRDTEYIGIVKDGSGVGRINVYPAYSSLLGTLQYILPREGYALNYVAYALKSLNLASFTSGTAIPHIYFRDYGEVEIAVPSLAEQERIVEILDREFEKIDALKANAERSLQQAKDLFQSALKQELKPKEGWVTMQIGNVCELKQGLAINAKTKYLLVKKSQLPLLRIKDLKDGTREIFVNESECPQSCRAYPEDIIYTRTGTLGLVFTGAYGVMHNNCFKIEIDKEKIDKHYLMYYLQQDSFRSNIIKLASRAAQPDITHKLFKEQIIHFPAIAEQVAITRKLSDFREYCQALEENYKKTIALCDDMKQALLRQAFNGEL